MRLLNGKDDRLAHIEVEVGVGGFRLRSFAVRKISFAEGLDDPRGVEDDDAEAAEVGEAQAVAAWLYWISLSAADFCFDGKARHLVRHLIKYLLSIKALREDWQLCSRVRVNVEYRSRQRPTGRVGTDSVRQEITANAFVVDAPVFPSYGRGWRFVVHIGSH